MIDARARTDNRIPSRASTSPGAVAAHLANPAYPRIPAAVARTGDHRRIVSATRPAAPATGPGVVEIRFDGKPRSQWEPDDVDFFDGDVRAAMQAAAGAELNRHEYRAYEAVVSGANGPQRSTTLCVLTSTFHFDDVARLQLDMAAQGKSIQAQQRTIATLSEVTEWRDIPAAFIDGPLDLRGLRDTPTPANVAPPRD